MAISETTKTYRGAWTRAQYQLLKRIAPREPATMDGSAFVEKGKIRTLLGDGFWDEIRGKVVLDFGCGEGAEAVEMALGGAEYVTGLDIQPELLEKARARAAKAGVGNRCRFATTAEQTADVVTSFDAFEHFDHPEKILLAMHGLLKPGGKVIATFGPTWYHPLGGHLFSVFPWAHLLFSSRH